MDNISYFFNKYVFGVGQNFEALTPEAKGLQLIESARNGRKEEVNALIKAGADLKNSNGCSLALLAATAKGHADIVELLIQNGAAFNWMAAHIAIINNQPTTAIRLFKYMPLEEIFRKPQAMRLFTDSGQENKAKKIIYDIIVPSVKVLPGSPFLTVDNMPFPKEIAERIFALAATLQAQSQDFPVWYKDSVASDLAKTIQFKIDKKIPILIFSNPNKRKADLDLEKEDNTKKIKTTASAHPENDNNDFSVEEMQVEHNNNSSCTIS